MYPSRLLAFVFQTEQANSCSRIQISKVNFSATFFPLPLHNTQ